ncbi:hypothetical protein B0T26DRAFT_713264 [Lasiosphaeria miniovina]|uniref:Uncharacterized protein n=1 Tax=Lasiosphaeria miniovina TaxID=1954250 RepID=A0AA40AM90_9PEZI|nr:uncharacterized protein B0T26DRAFT_713264 [Lasiosphaeria miniovina]KAK0718423.1 hypothetical protein B0T26DRAFT_713264 [Lasiosphaeria miniovina]
MIRQLAKDLGQTYSNIKPQPVVNGDGDEVPTPDLCTAFVRAWNEISRRNTTVQEDSHIILANLLGFNSRPILKLAKPEDRMSTILWSMDGIPMSLLFNKTGPRQNPAGNHRNRWVPLYPSRQRLRPGATYSNLRAIRGDLYLPNNSASRREMSVLVCTEYPEPNSTAKFSVWDASVGKRYTVEMHRQEGTLDPFAAPEVGPYCIVIQHKTDSGHTPTTMPGALFRIRRIVTNVRKWYNHNLEPEYVKSFELVEIEDAGEGRIGAKEKQKSASSELNDLGSAFARHHSGILRTVYDCPLTVSLQTEESTNGSSTKSVHEKEEKALALTPIPLPESWQVAIERDSPTFPVPLSSRPSFSEAMTPVAPYFLVTALDGLVASGCVALIIAICVTTFSLLAPLAKGVLMAKMGLHSLVLIQMFMLSGLEPRLIWDVLHLVLVALYAFSRVASGQPTALDFAFICWSLVGHGIDFAARLAIQWFVVPGLFEKYLANFDPEDGFWGQGDFLLTTTWYGRILARLGRKSGQDRAGQILGEVPEHWRSEQHLLGNMEG